MAIKDWKKGRVGGWEKNNIAIKINHAFLIKGKDWEVDIFEWRLHGSEIRDIHNEHFKTKKQALAYAKSYMRKH